jgi:molecular chaperone GrpE
MRKELAKDAERSRRDVLVSLLEVVDNLDRAINAAKTAPRPGSGQAGKDSGDLSAEALAKADPLLQGVEMVRQQFLSKLEGFGIKRIDTLGVDFDPLLHEAVTSVPAPDAASDGRVLGVITHGYRIGDEVLRPALVAVGKTPTSA